LSIEKLRRLEIDDTGKGTLFPKISFLTRLLPLKQKFIKNGMFSEKVTSIVVYYCFGFGLKHLYPF
jgi:hypothetical protein